MARICDHCDRKLTDEPEYSLLYGPKGMPTKQINLDLCQPCTDRAWMCIRDAASAPPRPAPTRKGS